MASLQKLKELEVNGIGSVDSIIQYMDINILTAFTSKRKTFYGLLALDSNPQNVPITALQKTVAGVWPDLYKNTLPNRQAVISPVDVYYKNEFLRDAYVALMPVYESATLPSTRNLSKQERRMLTESFIKHAKSCLQQVLDFSQQNLIKVGLPQIGSDYIWTELEYFIESYAKEINLKLNVLVFKGGKPHAKRR